MKAPYSLLVGLRSDEPILVVGGGALAERKVTTLLEAGCRPFVIAPTLTEPLLRAHRRGSFDWEPRKARREDFDGRRFVLLALPPEETRRLLPWTREAGCLVNAASLSEEGDWALVAQFGHDRCRIGVGSGGADPARAARLKKIIFRHLTDREVKS